MVNFGQLMQIVGERGVLSAHEVAERLANFANPRPQQALALVRPRNTTELAQVVALCAASGQPICIQGGKTGGSGSESEEGEIAISLERMARIENVDPVSRTATVEAGCLLEDLQAEAKRHDLYYGVDYGGRGSATLGGNISTNAGGQTVMRYGMTREQVIGLEAVLADGTVISSMTSVLKDNAGFDLKHLFIGTEGALGIVTRAVVRLRPITVSENCGFFAFCDFTEVTKFLAYCERNFGEALTCYEVMWRDHYVIASQGRQAPLPHHYPFYVIAETRGHDTEADQAHFETRMLDIMADGAIADGVLAKSAAERLNIWAIRENLDWLMTHPWLAYDISIPIAGMDQYVATLREELNARWPGSQLWVFGHIADGNLHIVVSPDADPACVREQIAKLVYSPLAAAHGSMSAEHGIGKDKVRYLHYTRSSDELALMQRLKQMMDPKSILNPGRVVPRVRPH